MLILVLRRTSDGILYTGSFTNLNKNANVFYKEILTPCNAHQPGQPELKFLNILWVLRTE
jgi:hypothetical protein